MSLSGGRGSPTINRVSVRPSLGHDRFDKTAMDMLTNIPLCKDVKLAILQGAPEFRSLGKEACFG